MPVLIKLVVNVKVKVCFLRRFAKVPAKGKVACVLWVCVGVGVRV